METKMRAERIAAIPVNILWRYREFKRDETPAPRIAFFNMYDVDEVEEYVEANGLEPLELSIIKSKALLTDGNHRIVAARRLGYEEVMVKVTVYMCDGRDTFYDHTLDRFKEIDDELGAWLKNLFIR